ncbi:MAG: hypothetical protein JST54_08425 [Deltaproteobacteria bacterium]|nr:hypothetical protein [Deltaproteobacteria bacterium]
MLAAMAMAHPAHAVETSGTAHAAVGGGYDSNPGRDLDGLAQGDGLLVGTLQLEGALTPAEGSASLSGHYDLGAKRFFTLSEDDLVAQGADVEASGQVGPLTLGVDGRAKDKRSRGDDRDYTDLAAGALGAGRAGKVPLRLDLGVERFIYHPDPEYDFTGPTLAFSVTVPLFAKQRLVLALSGSLRGYDPASRDGSGQVRADRTGGAGLTWRYRGKVLGELGYDFLADGSNQFGRSYQRHRLSGSVALFLPFQIALAAQGALQRTRFPDGVALSPELLLATDDESTNSLSVSLSRELPAGLLVELQAAGYQADYATNGLHYHRATVELRLGWQY